MARGAKKEETKNFKEFNIQAANHNDFTGRIYSGKAYDKGNKYGLSITINGISIKGVSLWVPNDKEKNASFMWPSFKDKDDNYVEYIVFYDEKDRADVTEVANKLADMCD